MKKSEIELIYWKVINTQVRRLGNLYAIHYKLLLCLVSMEAIIPRFGLVQHGWKNRSPEGKNNA